MGAKPPFKLKEIWSIRIRLQLSEQTRNLALFNLAIDSKLRGCDLVALKVRDIANSGKAISRATVTQKKTGKVVRFEVTEQARKSIEAWIEAGQLSSTDYLFLGRIKHSEHITPRQYARIVKSWAALIGLDSTEYGTHSLRRTKATLIYRRTKNLRAVQLLLGHTKLESTVRYLGIEVEDALEMAEQTEA